MLGSVTHAARDLVYLLKSKDRLNKNSDEAAPFNSDSPLGAYGPEGSV